MVRAGVLLGCALLLLSGSGPVDGQGTPISDYITVLGDQLLPGAGQALRSGCDCVVVALESGSCNGFCSARGCSNRTTELIACARAHCTGESDAGCATNVDHFARVCGTASAYILEHPHFCSVHEATLNYVMDAMTLHQDVRSACASVNDQIANDACQNACDAQTCAGYLGELQACAKTVGDLGCYFVLNSLRYHVASGFLDCMFFDGMEGACRTQQTGGGVSDLAASTFDELMPPEFAFVLGPNVTNSCTCLDSKVSECGLCSATDMCNAVNLTRTCAQAEGSGCGTDCTTALGIVENFLTVANGCFLVGDNDELNCTSTENPVSLTCDAFSQALCASRTDEVNDGDDVPIFGPIPSASPSTSTSRSATVSLTPSNTPTTSTTSSITPTISSSPSAAEHTASLGLAVLSCVVLVLFG